MAARSPVRAAAAAGAAVARGASGTGPVHPSKGPTQPPLRGGRAHLALTCSPRFYNVLPRRMHRAASHPAANLFPPLAPPPARPSLTHSLCPLLFFLLRSLRLRRKRVRTRYSSSLHRVGSAMNRAATRPRDLLTFECRSSVGADTEAKHCNSYR